MKTIVYASKKGGVSKTTSAIITGLILSNQYKVLIIDLDSQNALTSFFFDDLNAIYGKTILEAIKGEQLFNRVIYKINDNVSVIPSTLEFETIDEWQRTGKELILRKELKAISKDYDYVIIDTPGSMRIETILGLVAADTVVIPARLEKMDTRAITFTLEKLDKEIREDFNPTLSQIFILPTQYNYQNRTVNDAAYDSLKEEFPEYTLNLKIPLSSKISQFNYIGYEESKLHNSFDEYNQLVEVVK